MRQGPALTARRAALFLPLIVAGALPGVGTLLALVIVVILLCVFRDARDATLAHPRWLRSVAIGIVAGIAIALLIGLVLDQVIGSLVGKAPDVSALGSVKGDLSGYLRLAALALLYGAPVEETVFRGFAVGWGSALFGKKGAIPLVVLSAAVFGLTHLYQGWAGVISTGIIGLGYGAAYFAANRSLPAAIAAHMTVNAIGVTQLYLGL
jgi:membrane protease YdiL (CAAX protease family)